MLGLVGYLAGMRGVWQNVESVGCACQGTRTIIISSDYVNDWFTFVLFYFSALMLYEQFVEQFCVHRYATSVSVMLSIDEICQVVV